LKNNKKNKNKKRNRARKRERRGNREVDGWFEFRSRKFIKEESQYISLHHWLESFKQSVRDKSKPAKEEEEEEEE